MTKHDRAALQLALNQCPKDEIGQHGTWRERAERASYHLQRVSLRLMPWDEPPCVADEDDPNERDNQAQKLLRRVLVFGVSRYDPDPLASLAKAEAKGKGAA